MKGSEFVFQDNLYSNLLLNCFCNFYVEVRIIPQDVVWQGKDKLMLLYLILPALYQEADSCLDFGWWELLVLPLGLRDGVCRIPAVNTGFSPWKKLVSHGTHGKVIFWMILGNRHKFSSLKFKLWKEYNHFFLCVEILLRRLAQP